ncbi:putative translation initiation factor eif-2b epsilon protein [Neofusicoccum parvum UCRNP2]|uniref:Mannose-1-phosphate guanyltransferase n=1 Tax=Botryosphaeria parva (strain UCR-NP2) TaxID=1287680 RepID=R1EJX3_BOTPV|nr:putative translation initiation factor eif-2b epsilon protein [Neofusicoccum parvum UCRNP2]
MGPKSKKGASNDRQRPAEEEVEDPLQAVILADPFETRFTPLTLERPRCLLPLANTPLIEYTFEFLANAGVEEVFVYCGAHTDLVEEYIQNSKWYSLSSSFSKVELVRSASYTIGDAMRDLDQRGFLVGDFLIVIAPDLLAENRELEVRTDLIDCGIDICTPDVLALWSDNFDFQAPRRGFLHSVLKDYELNGKTIHTHIVDDHYAARVRNLHAYDSVSQDVISRWAYPLCPDSNLLRGQTYRFQKGNIYKEDGVILARSCVVNRGTVIGKDSSIGDGSVVSNSIIGRMCYIGKNVTIDGAYIWDNAVIGDNTVIKKAVVANEASIGKKCTIEPGALISYGVRISDGVTVDGSSRITRAKRRRLEGEEVKRAQPDYKVVGENGDGIEFVDPEDGDEDEIVEGLVPKKSIYNLASLSLSVESISTLNSESDFSGEGLHQDRSRGGSFVSINSDTSSHHAANFDHEAVDSLLDSFRKNDDSANIQLELASLRMTTNASEHQVRRALVISLVRRISEVVQSGQSIKQATDQVLGPHQGLISRTMFDKDASGKVDQVDFLLLLQADLAHRNDGDSILLHASMKLFDMDVLEEEAFEQWWSDAKASENEALEKVRSKTQQFIDFLAQEDESSEEDEDEDDDDDE